MKSTPTMLRATAPFVSLAGTLCLMMPAWAHGQNRAMHVRVGHSGASKHELRLLMRANSSQGIQQVGGEASHVRTPLLPPVNQILPVNPRINRFNGHSAFLNENNRVKAVTNGLELDLTSSDRDIVLGDRLFATANSYTINEGSEQRTLFSGSQVTAAEYVALQQVIAGGAQSLTVDQSGKGVGGQFTLNSISDGGRTINASQLVIPTNVTVSGDFGRSADGVKVTRDFVNFGTVEAYSSKSNQDTARIAARDISNEAGASISTDLNLSLRADNNLNNAGTISSAGNIDLSATTINNSGSITGGGNIGLSAATINNQGAISSIYGDVTLNAMDNAALAVNNTFGTISALNGAINVRTSDYTGEGNSTIYGGDLISNQLNLYSGQGSTDVTVNQLTGTVVSSGTAAHVSANTDTLVIGSQCLVGDPTYYNTGDIVLAGNVVVGEDLAIIAGGNITTTSAVLDIVAQGFNINIIAGANVTAGSGEIPPAGGPGTLPSQSIGSISNNTTSNVSFTGASTTGGSIDLTGATTQLTIVTSAFLADSKGGDLTLAAYQGSGGGKVLLPTVSTINTSGSGAGDNGSVTVTAGSTASGTTIQLGGVLNGGGTGAGGKITINASQPEFDTGSTMTFNTAGQITTGNRIVPGAFISLDADVSVFSIISAAADIDVVGGNSVNVTTFILSDGQSTGDVNGGNITLFSFNDITVGNLISAKASDTGNGGNVTVLANDTGTVSLAGIDTTGGATSGNGGAISIISSAGDVILNGSYTAATTDPVGVAGDITMSAGGTLNLTNVTNIRSSAFGSGANGNITLTSNQMLGGLNVASTGTQGTGSISVTTLSGGINSDGADVALIVDGSLNLNLGDNTINTVSMSPGAGGDITLRGSLNLSTSALSPLTLNASGNNGNGGNITYTDDGLTPTFVGVPAKIKKGPSNFLSILAPGDVDGNGGSVIVESGGNLFVDTTSLINNPASSGGPRNGGAITLRAGSNNPKGGSLIIVGDLNSDGIAGGNSLNITLTSASKKDFVLGSAKTPKNGNIGQLISTNGSIFITNTIKGIQVAADVVTADTLALAAAGKGKIQTKKGVTINNVANAEFNSESGDINAMLNVGSLFVNSNASATITSARLFPTLIFSSSAESMKVNGSSTIIIAGDVDTAKGDAQFTTSDGAIALLPSHTISAIDGDIILQATNTSTGAIDIGGNSQILTSGNKGGNITIAIGALPKKPLNPVPDQVGPPSVTNIGKGQTFFGVAPGGLSFTGTVNLIAENKNVVLNNATTNAQVISIGDPAQTVTIHADPPSKIASPSASLQLGTVMQLAGSTTLMHGEPSTTPQPQNIYATYSLDSTPNTNLLLTTYGVGADSRDPLSPTTSGGKQTDSDLLSRGAVTPIAIASLYEEFDYSTNRSLDYGAMEVCVWSDEELGLSETTMINPHKAPSSTNAKSFDTAAMKKGAVLFAPSRDAKVDTPFGTVEIAKDAIAFVLIDDHRLAVYDLHDSKKASVKIKSGVRETQLSPGRCVVFTNANHSRFEHLNPLRSVGYRAMASHSYSDGVTAFQGEFSTLSAISSVRPLRAVSISRHQNAKRILDRLIKTSAILLQLGAGEFRVYAEPSLTAMR